MPKPYPGEAGLIGITAFTLLTATYWIGAGSWMPALACLTAVVAGWQAVKSVNK
jgi:hypothetical protein